MPSSAHGVIGPVLAAGALVWGAPHVALGVPLAADSASDPAYSADATGAWKGLNPTVGENPEGMDNGGFGFGPWDFSGGFHDSDWSPYGDLNHFIDGVDFPASSFNDLGEPAFSLTNANQAHFNYTARATRVFERALQVGETIALEFDNPLMRPLASNDLTGFIVRLNGGAGPKHSRFPHVSERLGLFTTEGFHGTNWNLTDAKGISDTGLDSSATSFGAQLLVELTGTDAYRLQIHALDGNSALFAATGTLTGDPDLPIDTLEVVLFGNGSGNGQAGASGLATGQREFFFNRLSIDAPSPLLPGDYNEDHLVDVADYTVWRDHVGRPPGTLPNDVDGDVIGPAQYVTWKSNYGMLLSAPPSVQAALPEPSTGVQAILGMVIVILHLHGAATTHRNSRARPLSGCLPSM